MMTSKKERRAETAMRGITGLGGLTLIGLIMAAMPAQADLASANPASDLIESGASADRG